MRRRGLARKGFCVVPKPIRGQGCSYGARVMSVLV